MNISESLNIVDNKITKNISGNSIASDFDKLQLNSSPIIKKQLQICGTKKRSGEHALS